MSLAVALLLAALSRADLVERFRAAPVLKCDGLIEVSGMCPVDIRREFQLPVASRASTICKNLYDALGIKQRKFSRPAIVIFLGSQNSTNTFVKSSFQNRADGTKYLAINLLSPGSADMEIFQREITKGFLFAINSQKASDAQVEKILRLADPNKRLDDEYAEIAAWREKGIYKDGKTDEDYLKLMRRVKNPGFARQEEVLDFSSRLMLYPPQFAMPFCEKYRALTFGEAINLAELDVKIRYAAWVKSSELLVFGAGRGDKFTDMVKSYSEFLRALASYTLSKRELTAMLEKAESKLKEVLK
ncbi:MAG: hypothetical protein J6S51_03795 [Kiritimatiellae bacterium]|nr:hypothetical protein [Kiritimatiellia bacterium]